MAHWILIQHFLNYGILNLLFKALYVLWELIPLVTLDSDVWPFERELLMDTVSLLVFWVYRLRSLFGPNFVIHAREHRFPVENGLNVPPALIVLNLLFTIEIINVIFEPFDLVFGQIMLLQRIWNL